jgi:signal transduction histidine kinase
MAGRAAPTATVLSDGGRIEVSVRPNRDGATIAVRDHGCGVPEADLDRIFEAFYRVEEARERDSGGTGLGLAITARVMALHGDHAKAHNAPDGGLAIELHFPQVHIAQTMTPGGRMALRAGTVPA